MGEPSNDPRAERLKAALRENLKRRKVQIRGRAAGGSTPSGEPPGSRQDAAPPAQEPEQDPGQESTSQIAQEPGENGS